jgi:tetratricopeptide (TPR) repeat protein
MFHRLRASLAVAAAAALLIVPLIPQAADAQARDGARFRVIVPDLQPTDGSRDRFGERVADRVRDLLDLDTHVAMSQRDIDRAARDFDLRYRDLDCTMARQLASQIDVPLVMCGEYHEEDGQFQVAVSFFTVPAGEEFVMEPVLVAQNDEAGAAQNIRTSFEGMVEQVQNISWCQAEYASSNWDQALRYCTRAVELAPHSHEARYALGRTYLETEQWQESLDQFEHLLAEDPRNDDVLENAAWVAGQVGDTDKAREYYTRFLEINPDNVNVRIRVAYDLAQAGDSYGAMTLLEEGIEQEPENVDLHEAYGSYAFRAAVERQATEPQPATQDGDAPSVSPEVAELFRTAIRSYEVVMEERGSEARASYAVNSMRAYRQLDEPQEAIRIGRRAAEFHPDDAQIQSQLANAYNDAGDVDSAITALERALEIQPDLPQARTRQGAFLMQAGRVNEAITAFEAAAQAGEQRPDQLAGMIFSHGYSNYIQDRSDLQEGIRLIERAKQFDVSTEFREQLDFFHGYALMRRGEQVQQPQNLESARASRPIFQRSRELFQAGSGYAQRSGQNLSNLLEAVDTYIEIQDAIIARESRNR